MEEQIVELLVAGIAVIGAIYFARKFRHQIREKIAEWLRARNLEKSALMDVLMVCDTIAGAVETGIICKIFVTTKQTGEQEISNQTYTPEEIKKIDPDVFNELIKRGHATKSIMAQVV